MPAPKGPRQDETGQENDLARSIRELSPRVVEEIKESVAGWPAPSPEQLPPVARPLGTDAGTDDEQAAREDCGSL